MGINRAEEDGIKYYHLVSTHRGNRYFKVDWLNNTCVQIVITSGDTYSVDRTEEIPENVKKLLCNFCPICPVN